MKTRIRTCLAIVPAFVMIAVTAAGNAQVAPYTPERQVSGTIRSWGSEQMQELLRLWEDGFRKFQPAVHFDDHLKGTVSAMGGLYAGAADLALMGREIWPTEQLAYSQTMGHDATGVEVATGSFDVPTKADALAVFVHKENPMSHATLAQLDGIFGAEHRRAGKSYRTWDDLGVAGSWRGQPIHPYGPQIDNAAAIFFSNTVMNGSRKWNPNYAEFANRTDATGRRTDYGKLILDALALDRYGIAISNPHYAGPQVKALALVTGDQAEPVMPTRDTVLHRTYPLARAVFIFFNRDIDGNHANGLNPVVREFLRYVLSSDGQRDILREGAYLPLPLDIAQQELQKLR